MRVKIGPYKNWVGPYQIAEKLLFWMDKDNDPRVHKFGSWLANDKKGEDSYLTKFCNFVDSKKKRKVKVKIDKYDIWNMNDTLAYMILPLLKEMKKDKNGSPLVDDSDVPEGIGLRSSEAPPKENEYDSDGNLHKRWEWVLDEMIWAFEQLHPDYDWEEQYSSGEIDIKWVPSEEKDDKGEPVSFKMTDGPKNTYKCDYEGMKKHGQRIQRGTMLFGKYYQNLWT